MRTKQKRDIINFFRQEAEKAGKAFQCQPTRRGLRLVYNGRGKVLTQHCNEKQVLRHFVKALGL